MKAVVLEEQGVINVRVRSRTSRIPGPGELRIAPYTVGVCGSDLHYYTHGRVGKYVVEQPMILGHEAAGTVLEVGPGVTDFKPGDRVAPRARHSGYDFAGQPTGHVQRRSGCAFLRYSAD